MSQHDHSHPSHDHPHEHGHGHEQPEPLHPTPLDDAGTKALSEALSSSFFFIRILVVILIGALVISCIRTVESNEVAVILRFGKPVGVGANQIRKPGLHFALPYPIDEIVRIRIGESHTVTSSVGWYSVPPELAARGIEPDAGQAMVPGVDGYTLTSDDNIIHVRATMKYRITDPLQYQFDFADAPALLENILNNAIIYASAQFTADAALYKDKTAFREKVRERVVSSIQKARFGIALEDALTVEARPPLSVRQSFDSVIDSEQQRSQRILQAQGNAKEMLLRAEGEAKAIYNSGQTSSNQLVRAVSAEADYFREQLPHYLNDPRLFERRLLAQTMERVLTNAQDKFYLPNRADGKSREVRLQLNREPEGPKIKSMY